MPGLPQNIKDITKWPNTPSQAQFKGALNFRQESAESRAPVLVVDTDGMRPDKARQTLTAAMDCFEVDSVLTEAGLYAKVRKNIKTG